MTFHHLLPKQKGSLYRKLFKALKPGGVYIEGDYIVPEGKMNHLLNQYHALPDETKGGTHHIDIPLSLAVQFELLRQVGFAEIEEVYAQEENSILKAMKS